MRRHGCRASGPATYSDLLLWCKGEPGWYRTVKRVQATASWCRMDGNAVQTARYVAAWIKATGYAPSAEDLAPVAGCTAAMMRARLGRAKSRGYITRPRGARFPVWTIADPLVLPWWLQNYSRSDVAPPARRLFADHV